MLPTMQCIESFQVENYKISIKEIVISEQGKYLSCTHSK